MPFCIKCGTELGKDAAFCPYCGASQPLESDSKEEMSAPNRPQGASSKGVAPKTVNLVREASPKKAVPTTTDQQPSKPPQNNRTRILLVSVAILLVVVVAVLVVVGAGSSGGAGGQAPVNSSVAAANAEAQRQKEEAEKQKAEAEKEKAEAEKQKAEAEKKAAEEQAAAQKKVAEQKAAEAERAASAESEHQKLRSDAEAQGLQVITGVVQYTTMGERAMEVGGDRLASNFSSQSSTPMCLVLFDNSQTIVAKSGDGMGSSTFDIGVIEATNGSEIGLPDGAHVCVAVSSSDLFFASSIKFELAPASGPVTLLYVG